MSAGRNTEPLAGSRSMPMTEAGMDKLSLCLDQLRTYFAEAEAKGAGPLNAEILRTAFHEIRQPLNVIRMANGNIKHRLQTDRDKPDVEYLLSKADRIEAQAMRAHHIMEQILAALP